MEQLTTPKSFVIRPKTAYCLVLTFPIFLIAFCTLSAALFFPFYSLIILIPFGIISLYALYKYLLIRSYRYEISQEKITWSRGILSRNIDFLELYRVKDYRVQQPLTLRIIGSMHLILETSDRSHPIFLFKGIPYSNFPDELRKLVEFNRDRKRVYEVD